MRGRVSDLACNKLIERRKDGGRKEAPNPLLGLLEQAIISVRKFSHLEP